MDSFSAMPADKDEIKIKEPVFYSQYTPTKILATSDADALIVEVTAEAQRVDYLFGPMLRFIGTGAGLISDNRHLCGGAAGAVHLSRSAADDLRLRRQGRRRP